MLDSGNLFKCDPYYPYTDINLLIVLYTITQLGTAVCSALPAFVLRLDNEG